MHCPENLLKLCRQPLPVSSCPWLLATSNPDVTNKREAEARGSLHVSFISGCCCVLQKCAKARWSREGVREKDQVLGQEGKTSIQKHLKGHAIMIFLKDLIPNYAGTKWWGEPWGDRKGWRNLLAGRRLLHWILYRADSRHRFRTHTYLKPPWWSTQHMYVRLGREGTEMAKSCYEGRVRLSNGQHCLLFWDSPFEK